MAFKFKKGKNFLRLGSQHCAAVPRQKAFFMVARRHTIKGGAPRLACEWVPVETKIFETIAAALYTPLDFHCDHWKANMLREKKQIIKKNNYK